MTILGAKILLPDHEHWDDARRAWNLAVDQRPAAIVLPESPEDVVAAVHLAREHGLRLAPQGPGHRAAPLGPLEDSILLRTERMRDVEVDADARIARVAAGALTSDLAEAAAGHGLAALSGSGPDVGVVGYTLAGGIGWLGRRHGLAANSVEAVELVTADGRIVRADRDNEPDLFWALRGGGGSFGVVTALEVRLVELTEAYAGILWWPIERGDEVLQAWRELTERDLPDELTTVGRYLRIPPVPELPEHLRGRSFAIVEAIHLGDRAQADDLLAPLRALEPEMDTIETIPASELIHVHRDPAQPVPGVADGLLLSELPAAAVDELVRVAGAESGSPLVNVEVRQLGGELRRARPENGALAALDAGFVAVGVGIAASPEQAAAGAAQLDKLREALAPWTAAQQSMNFADTPRDPRSFWPAETYERLRAIEARIDPDDLIRANHPLSGER